MAKSVKKKKIGGRVQQKLYFDNDLITTAVIEYQANGDRSLLEPHIKAFQDLVNGVINTSGVWRFWGDRKELESEGFKTILQCLERYEDGAGTSLFSYLSIAVKFRLRNWTRSENRRFGYTESIDEARMEDVTADRRKAAIIMDWKGNFRARKISHVFENVINNDMVNDEKDVVRQTMKNAACSEAQVRWVIEQIRAKGNVCTL